MEFSLLKLIIAIFLINKACCLLNNQDRFDLEDSFQYRQELNSKQELLRRKYLKLRPILDKLFNINDEAYETSRVDQSSYLNDILSSEQDRDWSMNKRAFFGSSERFEKLNKGKRVNKKLYSSGLQGVWGVPGRR